ncbi:MAG: hypothetical protein R3F60_15960 [bacterium]
MANPLDLLNDPDFGLTPPPSRRPVYVIVVLVFGLAIAGWLLLPGKQNASDCGDLSGWSDLSDEEQPALAHDMVCTAEVTVAGVEVVALGSEDKKAKDPARRYRDVRLFARAKGAPVILAVSAADPAVRAWQAQHGSLAGFGFKGRGRLFDPDQEKGYAPLGRTIRDGLGLGSAPVFIFDPQGVK